MTDATALLTVERPSSDDRRPAVDIVIPVFNEQDDLEASVRRLTSYLADRFPLPWVVTIADNASVDRTWGIACRLANEVEGVRAVHLEQKGRGRALRATWSASEAPVVAYMDVDLSTDLAALLPLVAPLLSGHSDLSIGTRLATGSRVVRGPKREAISRTYNLLLKATLRSGFSDAQCGFKAVRTDVARALLPLVEDEGWFFDTELLVLAEENGLRIHEVPVDWVDDPGSTVDVVRTARDDLAGVWRMLRRSAAGSTLTSGALRVPAAEDSRLVGQLVRFASIGAVSTVVFGALFWVLAGPLGAVGADAVALAVCALANTAANRRLTFSLRGRAHRARHYTAGSALAVLPFLATLVALGGLAVAGVDGLLPRLLALTVVNGGATLGRFVVLRRWVFGGPGR
jgi:putative flippase GtrA